MSYDSMGDELIPSQGDVTVRLPVTFDYNGGRRDNIRNSVLASLIMLVVCLIICVGTCMSGGLDILSKLLIVAIICVTYFFVLRFFMFKEMTYSDAYESLKESDSHIGMGAFWNIYEIDYAYPYICHFRDGKLGLFVKLEKGVIVGVEDDVLFTHYDAISDAYMEASRLKINMCHIDYMDNIGNDTRIEELYSKAGDCENIKLQEILFSIIGNLQDEMSREYATYDVYLFTYSGRAEDLWNGVRSIVGHMLGGNYITYQVLNIDGIRSVCKALYNLHDFSAVEACDSIFEGQRYGGIVPIRVEHSDGTVDKLNKTMAEIEAERQEKIELERQAYLQEMEAKQSKKKKKRKSRSKDTDISVGTSDEESDSLSDVDLNLFD